MSPSSSGDSRSGDEEKAISTQATHARNSNVNPSARPRANGSSSRVSRLWGLSNDKNFHFRDDEPDPVRKERSRSPFRHDRTRSRSPFRASKGAGGEKRRREDDHYAAKSGSDPRRFKVHYEDGPRSAKSGLENDERSSRGRGAAPKFERGEDRSQSPFHHEKLENDDELQSGSNGRRKLHDRPGAGAKLKETRRESTAPLTQRESTLQAARAKDDAKFKMSLLQQSRSTAPAKAGGRYVRCHSTIAPITDNVTHSQGRTQVTAESTPEVAQAETQMSEAEIIEQRRKKREAIKARYKPQSTLLVQALEQSTPSVPPTPAHDSSGAVSDQHSPPVSADSPQTPYRDSPPESPAAVVVNDDDELANHHQTDDAANAEGPSAADYDDIDMEEDRPDHKKRDAQEPEPNGAPAASAPAQPEAPPKQSKEFDMFADDDDDEMFAPVDAAAKPPAAGSTKQAKTLDQSLLDNWDYPDGHYRIILGELLDGRYAVQQQIGKGTFATVVRAQDTKTGNIVAVKIACNNETMYKAGQKEMDMLQLLNQADPEDKRHIIRLLRNFDHKGHMCLVFENLSADLREVLKKFGRNIGINLKAIRSYAQQMFHALGHMKKCQILHADLKPDNILVSEKRSVLKVCDLGTAAFAQDAEVTPYLVSRFYRAPEVILGIPFDYAIDMWSIGCTLFELYTGRILFAGADNNQMLRAIQECRGKFPIRMLKQSSLADKHFDVQGTFLSQEREKGSGRVVVRPVVFPAKIAQGKDLRSRLSGNVKGLSGEEMKEHAEFVELMERCLQLDPAKRISPGEALRCGFIARGAAGGQEGVEKVKGRVVPAMPAGMVRMK